ncbi:MAG: nucleotidyltransferase family protein [Oscillospiraceae bacterium]|nr:nucleotidyltransferase family protein [Oscillospiraceae bacterium]
MKIVGIICEYNPLHLGHKKQIHRIRSLCGEDTAVVCLMSGNFVQRGAPAIIDKSLRAKAAVLSGADLVLELPVQYALSSAEGFAAGGVEILGGFCDGLCFGAETNDKDALLDTARALLSPEFPALLRDALETGKSFPAARQAALTAMGLDGELITSPNNILAVEYCKAILSCGCTMEPMPIHRGGSYHDTLPDEENPSATALRRLLLEHRDCATYMPQAASIIFENAPLHTLAAGERAILSRLRTMTDEEFEALPYGSEGLWRKFMHACRSQATVEEIITATKSKRYTRTRLDRMLLCAFLGLTEADLRAPVPYTRVLAFNDRGRAVLKEARKSGTFLNAGERHDSDYCRKEFQIGDLYGLFAVDGPEAPGVEEKRRVYYHKEG